MNIPSARCCHLIRLTLVLPAAIWLAGCDLNALKQGRTNQDAPASNGATAQRPELEDVSGPPSSGLPFTLWNAHATRHELLFDYRSEGRRKPGTRYRIMVNSSEGAIAGDFLWVQATTHGKAKMRLPFLIRGLTDATMHIEEVPLTPHDSVTRVSNTVTVKTDSGVPNRRPVATAPREGSNTPLRGPGLGHHVDRAWLEMDKQHDEDKIAVIRLTRTDTLVVSEKFLEIIESFSAGDSELKSSVVTTGGVAAAVLAPVNDLQALAAKIDFGTVTAVDTSRRVIEVTPHSDVFPKNELGIAFDPTHPDFFNVNARILSGELLLSGHGGAHSDLVSPFADKQRQQVLARLKTEDPQRCGDSAIREIIIRAFRNAVLDEMIFGDARRDAIEGLARWSADDAVRVFISLLEGGGRDAFFLRNADLMGTVVRLLGEIGDDRAVEPLARMLGDTSFGIKPVEKPAIAAALTKIGVAAEPLMIQLAPHNDPEVSRLSIQVLGDVGTQESLSILRQARRSRNPVIRAEAERAADKINSHRRDAEG